MSPSRRRRPGDNAPDAASFGLEEASGTGFIDESEDGETAGSIPEEPAWMREAPADGVADPAVAAPPPDPVAVAAARAARAAEIVKALNPEQARAVTTTEGPLLILAGAGCGKTRVLAHRVAYLVGVKDVAPWQILAVTFTNKAAAELRERIIGLVGEGGRDVQTGTFHALCARVLRRDGEAIGLDRRFVIYDTDDQQALMKQILREEDLPLTGEFRPGAVLGRDQPGEERDARPRASWPRTPRNHRERRSPGSPALPGPAAQAAGALDFDDLLLEAVRLFDEAPDVLARYQERWRYLHVDEYQDTNRAQYLWVQAPRGEATTTSASWATTTSRSTPGAAPTSATSSTSSATTRTRRSSSWSRTTAPPS